MASAAGRTARTRKLELTLRFMLCTSRAPAVRGGVGEDVLQPVAARAERARHRRDLVAVGRVLRRAQAHRAEDFLDLAARERVARAELLAERLRAAAGARERCVPPKERVRALAPAVLPG